MDEIRQLVAQYTAVPADPADPFELDSLALVSLVEDLEEAFDLVVRPAEVVPAHFASLSAIEAFVKARQ